MSIDRKSKGTSDTDPRWAFRYRLHRRVVIAHNSAMPGESIAEPPKIGLCRGCGYRLRGLASDRCPECGRAFDPADPATMRFGREPGFIGRILLRRIPLRVVLLLMIAAALAIGFATRPQLGEVRQWELAPVDLQLYALDTPRNPSVLVTSSDIAYAAGLWTWALLLAIFLPWWICRAIALRFFDTIRPRTHRPLRRLLLGVVLLVLSSACVLVGWPYRLGRHVAAVYIANSQRSEGNTPLADVKPRFPIGEFQSSQFHKDRIIQSAVLQAPDPKERIAGVAMAQAMRPEWGLSPIVRDAVLVEKDPLVLEWEIRLIGMLRDAALEKVLNRYMASPDVRVRIATLDAIALANRTWDRYPHQLLTSTPKIPVVFPSNGFIPRYGEVRHHVNFSAGMQQRIGQMMVAASDPAERDAAAAALQSAMNDTSDPRSSEPGDCEWPLRLGEWGVWVDAGHLRSADEVIDDVPPFVHHFNDSLASLSGSSSSQPTRVHKPVMHFYCDRPLALKLVTNIDSGRVNYVFPNPDQQWKVEFAGVSVPENPLAMFDVKSGGTPFNPRQPLTQGTIADLAPASPLAFMRRRRQAARTPTTVSEIGVQWQSLILTPQQQPWMQLPSVPADAKYAWSSRLRQVPSAWVHNRGESERFVYYDGSSLSPPVVRVRLGDPQHLQIDTASWDNTRGMVRSNFSGRLVQTARAGHRRTERRGLYIHVENGAASADIVPVPAGDTSATGKTYTIGSTNRLSGDKVESTLRDWIIDAGLTSEEADGLLACWRDTFFKRPGRRFVLLMSAQDYDWLCPIWIDPMPQTMARVGLVWTELKPGQSPATKPDN